MTVAALRPVRNMIFLVLECCLAVFTLVIGIGFAEVGVRVLLRGHVYVPSGTVASHRWFTHSLYGLPARFAGFAYIAFGFMLFSFALRHRWIAAHLPNWARVLPWWFFGAWFLLYFIAYYMPKT
jgi:hypothetical protein